ncbi:hypothetical protein [Chromobacterium violaceum]|uniref:hypothetical protein n=1 Tax=Chromobacterium violaceum TaxID=536 RepID=UPI001C38967C|nr:hypothetical protein [Chromobacterium violaceum]
MSTTTIQRTLTPTTDAAPAILRIPEPELSGSQWVSRYPGSAQVSDLDPDFGAGVSAFITALRAAGARVSISATFRPIERAYLIRTSWEIKNKKVKPDKAASFPGVNINWDHGDDEKSIAAARAMCAGYSTSSLGTRPALKSRHTERKAIDMTITWSGDLTIQDADGNSVVIKTQPRTGMNAELKTVGASYGVIKFWKGAKDKPHWSTDGR